MYHLFLTDTDCFFVYPLTLQFYMNFQLENKTYFECWTSITKVVVAMYTNQGIYRHINMVVFCCNYFIGFMMLLCWYTFSLSLTKYVTVSCMSMLFAYIMMSHTRFRVNLQCIFAWVSRNSILEIGVIYEA